jgi:hypothetical protein
VQSNGKGCFTRKVVMKIEFLYTLTCWDEKAKKQRTYPNVPLAEVCKALDENKITDFDQFSLIEASDGRAKALTALEVSQLTTPLEVRTIEWTIVRKG